MDFELIGSTEEQEIIAVGRSIWDLPRLQKAHGRGRWRKLEGVATIRLASGAVRLAEVHWYEAHGIS